MRVGFARACISPPPGTPMTGFGGRDRAHGCEGVHDDVFARALFLEDERERALIMGFDICFFGREDADRVKGAIGRRVDLSPRQILLNASHTHTGPAVGQWGYNGHDAPPDPLFVEDLTKAAVRAAGEARDAAREATLWAGCGRTELPVSRRKPDGKGGVEWRPYPEGTVYRELPLCLFKDARERPICLLFSVSCHPSTVGGWLISADYPGAAMAQLDGHLGLPCSLFLQGAGGDTKACVIADGRDETDVCWRRGEWPDVAKAGELVAHEVIRVLDRCLRRAKPQLRTAMTETRWPLAPHVGRPAFEQIANSADDSAGADLKKLWARSMLRRLDRGEELVSSVPVSVHGVQLAEDVRIVGLEGEAVAALGLVIRDFYGGGVTFPLGYTDGAQLYLPSSAMIDEGGYEVESYYEYGFPAPLEKGMEGVLTDALKRLRQEGIE